jgi:hypothetical protein
MNELKPCTRCGGTFFGEGQLNGDVFAVPLSKIWGNYSSNKILLTVCTNCGEISSLRIGGDPKRFLL